MSDQAAYADASATTPDTTFTKWMKEIERAEKYFQTWFQKAEKIVKLYRKQDDEVSANNAKRRFAMLWANTEVLKPTVYAQPPEPAVARRFKDKDPVGRIASDILERASSYEFERGDLDDTLKAARDDLLLPGRGVAWVRFLEGEKVITDYIHWRDFLHSPARRWKEVTWIGKRSYFTKKEMLARFTKITKEKLGAPDNVPKTGTQSEDEKKALEGKYSVWEIWDKTSRKVIFITSGCKEPLEIVDPFLTLESFWPCPKPLYATLTTDSLIPIPDYKYYQDQAEEIDDLTRRISSLTDSLKVVGFYPRGAEDASTAIERALKPEVENEMIGVESWAAFSEKGGAGGIIFLPIKQVADTIKACVELRRQLIDDVYQITGLSDIQRGATDPNETATAQQLKAQNGSIRVRDRQQEVQRFARDLTRIICEIIAEKFQPATLMAMTNMNTPENNTPEKKQQIEQAFQLMRDDRLRGFRIDIETDSTIAPDENAEKERRVEFMTAIGGFMKEALPLVQAQPLLLPLVGEMLRFVVRGFRTGRQLEDAIDRAMQQLEQAAAQAQQNPQKTPEQEKVEAEKEKMAVEMQMKGQEQQANLAVKGQEMQMRQQEHAQEMDFRREEHALDTQQQQQGAVIDMQTKQMMARQQMAAAAQKQQQAAANPINRR